jgi:hypothetical protein
MRLRHRRLLALPFTITALAVAVPVSSASAQTFPFAGSPVNTIGGTAGPTGCSANEPAGGGFAGGTTALVCTPGLTFVGPAIGQVASAIGPTIIGATVLAPINVSTGPVQN